MSHAPEKIVRELLPLVRGFCAGECAVALGGSHAKGLADERSDVDVYLFADRVLPAARRNELVTAALGDEARVTSWGREEPGEEFVQGGTDFVFRGQTVECWLRSTRQVEDAIAAAVRGEVRREYTAWTVMGFFGHTVLADVRAMRVVHDPGGTLAGWKRRVEAYPDALRAALLGRYLAEAAFWPHNLHYLGAVERGDAIYTSGIVQLTVQALVQVVFALNREYFPGEKALARVLPRLAVQPRDFAGRVRALLYPGEPTIERLREQRLALASLVGEMEALVREGDA